MSYKERRNIRLASWLGTIIVVHQSSCLCIIRLPWVLDLALDSIYIVFSGLNNCIIMTIAKALLIKSISIQVAKCFEILVLGLQL